MTSTSENTISFQINEDYTVDIRKYIGSYGEYYSVNGTNYDIHFPIDWVFQTPTETDVPCFGPEECNLCAEFGFYGGVFIGYCLHCAKTAEFKRGNGMIYSGVEINQKEADKLGIPIEYKEENSMWNVYMQTVDLLMIGDESLLTNYLSFFKNRKKNNTMEMEKVFDFYGWLNYGNPVNYYISQEEDMEDLRSVESEKENTTVYKNLSLVLPELEVEEEVDLEKKNL